MICPWQLIHACSGIAAQNYNISHFRLLTEHKNNRKMNHDNILQFFTESSPPHRKPGLIVACPTSYCIDVVSHLQLFILKGRGSQIMHRRCLEMGQFRKVVSCDFDSVDIAHGDTQTSAVFRLEIPIQWGDAVTRHERVEKHFLSLARKKYPSRVMKRSSHVQPAWEILRE